MSVDEHWWALMMNWFLTLFSQWLSIVIKCNRNLSRLLSVFCLFLWLKRLSVILSIVFKKICVGFTLFRGWGGLDQKCKISHFFSFLIENLPEPANITFFYPYPTPPHPTRGGPVYYSPYEILGPQRVGIPSFQLSKVIWWCSGMGWPVLS